MFVIEIHQVGVAGAEFVEVSYQKVLFSGQGEEVS
jgi:hypothetical protein